MPEGQKNYESSQELEKASGLENLEIDLLSKFSPSQQEHFAGDEDIQVNHEGHDLDLHIQYSLDKKESGELSGGVWLTIPTENKSFHRAYVHIDFSNRRGVYTATSILARHGQDIVSAYPALHNVIEQTLQKLANESTLPITHNATTRGVQLDKKLFEALKAWLQTHGYEQEEVVQEMWEEWKKTYTPQKTRQ